MPNLLEFSPGIDLFTDRVAVVMQDRPVVGLSGWLLDAFAAAGHAGRHLQLVTPARTRITYQARTRLFAGADSRWVVQEPDGSGAYDGLSGLKLAWDGERYAPVRDGDGQAELSQTFITNELDVCPNLLIEARVRFQALDTTTVGRSAELLFQELTGAPPAGWGTEEPVSQPWGLESLTAFCRNRAPRGSWLTLVGARDDATPAATGSIEIHSHAAGIEEIVRLAVARPAGDQAAATDAAAIAGGLADRFDLISLLVMSGPAGLDTNVPPHLVGFPGPIGIGLGADILRSLGADSTTESGIALEGLTGTPVGSKSRPAGWYPIGNGEDQRDWNHVTALLRRIAEVDRQRRETTTPQTDLPPTAPGADLPTTAPDADMPMTPRT